MAARAMWKAVLRFAEVQVPVKLYAAVQDRTVHFRLLHEKDHAPVRQAMVNPETDEVVPYEHTRRAFVTEEKDLVVLREDELAAIEPEPSREIRVTQFLPPEVIDHRWYLRPYYLGPDDGAGGAYSALAEALGRAGREGLARWTMRKKEYVGALRLHDGYPMLIALRHAEELVPLDEIEAPPGPKLDARELDMARRLIDMLAADFDPEAYHDEYRARVEELIETKARGGRVTARRAKPPRPSEDLAGALEASLKQERKRA